MQDGDYWKAIFEESEKKRMKIEAENKYLKKDNSKLKRNLEVSEAEKKYLKKNIEVSEAKRDKLSFKTLITAPPKVELSAGACTSSNVMSNAYKTAKINEVEITFKLESTINKNHTRTFKLDDFLNEKTKDCPSTLLLHFTKLNKKGQNLTYYYCSEADISSLIQRALEDATYLAQCKTGRNFVTRHEYSIFSLRPDHFVVLEDNIPLLTVEDKKPWNTKKDKDTDLGRAYGQLYDYAMMMKAFGTSASFLVLTCYEQSRMLWLDSEKSNEIAYDENGVRDKCFSGSPPQGKENTPSPLKFKSPDKSVIKIVTKPNEQTGFQSSNNERVLNSSRSFDSTHLVPLLYTAILCAVNAIPHKQSKLKIPLLENEELKECKTLKMGSGWRQYDWGHLSAAVGQKIDGENCYYMMDIIGIGSTSKVFYALHSSGKPCVIKMFVNRAIEDKNGETFSKEHWIKVAEEKTKTEKDNFDNLYPFLRGEVKVEMILGFYCVVMPFFRPLKNKAERQGRENEIKQVLKRFHDNNLQYLDCDLCWRHIGYHNEEIVLYDLADLTSVGDEISSSDVFVDKCWEGLQNRL
jgi:hypothetical protein